MVVSDEHGDPLVIRVASVVDGKPFPTLYWLLGEAICLRIDRLEAAGWIAALQQRVDDSENLRQAMLEDHDRHRRERDGFLSVDERAYLTAQGMLSALDARHWWYRRARSYPLSAHLVCRASCHAKYDRWLGR